MLRLELRNRSNIPLILPLNYTFFRHFTTYVSIQTFVHIQLCLHIRTPTILRRMPNLYRHSIRFPCSS